MASSEVVDLETGAGAGLGRVDHHVGTREEVVQALVADVELHSQFARVAVRPEQRLVTVAGRQRPGRRPSGRLDLDHLGTEVAEHAAAELAALDGEIDDADSIQGTWHPRKVVQPTSEPKMPTKLTISPG